MVAAEVGGGRWRCGGSGGGGGGADGGGGEVGVGLGVGRVGGGVGGCVGGSSDGAGGGGVVALVLVAAAVSMATAAVRRRWPWRWRKWRRPASLPVSVSVSLSISVVASVVPEAVAVGSGGGWVVVDGEHVQATTARTATATTATARDWKTWFYKRPTGPMYPSMGLPGGEKGSAVVEGTCVRACVGMPGVCVLRVCVRERRGGAGKRTFRRDWLQSLPRICEAPARAGVEGGCSLPRCLTASL